MQHALYVFILYLLHCVCYNAESIQWDSNSTAIEAWEDPALWSTLLVPTATSEVSISKYNPNIILSQSTKIESLLLGYSKDSCPCYSEQWCLQTLIIKENVTLTITSSLDVTRFGSLVLQKGASIIVSDGEAVFHGSVHGSGTITARTLTFYSDSQIDPWNFNQSSPIANLTFIGTVYLGGIIFIDITGQNSNDKVIVNGYVTVDNARLIMNSFSTAELPDFINFIEYSKVGNGTLAGTELAHFPYHLIITDDDTRDTCISQTPGEPEGPDVGGNPIGCANPPSNGGFGVLLQSSINCPVCSAGCVHGYCVGDRFDSLCSCNGPWTGDTCNIPVCSGCNIDHGTCKEVDGIPECVCKEGWTDSTCNTIFCPEDCNNNGVCSSFYVPPKCECDRGFDGNTCNTMVPVGTCPGNCSGHGLCNTATSECTCDSGWTRFNCDSVTCPGSGTMCNSHGTCEMSYDLINNSTSGICKCESGWNGDACENNIMTCPNDCSGSGSCDTSTGIPLCNCRTSYSGADCSLKLSKKGRSRGTTIAIIVSVTVGGVFVIAGAVASVVYAKKRKNDEDYDLQMQ